MKVFVLMKNYPYEGDELIGVFSTDEKAQKAEEHFESKDNSNGYNGFYIEEVEVDALNIS